MKKLISNAFIALISSVFTFFIFSTYYQPEPVIIEKNPARLVHQTGETFVNAKPLNKEAAILPDFTTVSKKATASVVNITAYSSSGYRVSTGSGVITSSNGYIIIFMRVHPKL